MKKTKKISIVLSSIALVTGALGGNNISIMALDDFSGVVQSLEVPDDQLSLIKNDAAAYLKIDSIRYKEGGARGTVVAPENGDWYVKKILVGYMNYGQGVAEDQADQNLATFTTARDNNWVILSRYEPFPAAAKKQQDFFLNQSNKDANAYTNKSDIFYYAVEFGRITENRTWGDSWWSRGKIDYRECVHSGVFQEDTMICQRYEDGDTVRYVPKMINNDELVMPPENEQVISWKEEWKSVIQVTYEAVQIEVEQMRNYLNNGLNILDKDDKILDGVVASLKHYTISEPELLWLSDSAASRKIMIAEMRKFFEGTDSTSVEIMQKEIELLKIENMSLRQEKVILETENDELVQNNEKMMQEKATLEQRIAELETKNTALEQENDELRKKGIELELENGDLMSEGAELKQKNEEMAIENSEIKELIGALRAEKVDLELRNSVWEAEKAELEQRNKEREMEVSILKTQVENMTVGQNSDSSNAVIGMKTVQEVEEKMTDGQDSIELSGELDEVLPEQLTEESDVQMPMLGGEEIKIWSWWWLLIPVVGLVGAVILLTRRRFVKE